MRVNYTWIYLIQYWYSLWGLIVIKIYILEVNTLVFKLYVGTSAVADSHIRDKIQNGTNWLISTSAQN